MMQATWLPRVRRSLNIWVSFFLKAGGGAGEDNDAILKLHLRSAVECDRPEQNQQVGEERTDHSLSH